MNVDASITNGEYNPLTDRDSIENHRLERIYDLLDAAAREEQVSTESMRNDIRNELASASAALANAEESMKQAILNDIMYSDAEVENINKIASKYVNFDLQNAVNEIVDAGEAPVMSFNEKSLYQMHSPADAYIISREMRDFENEISNGTQEFNPGFTSGPLGNVEDLPIYPNVPPPPPPPPPPIIPPPPPPPPIPPETNAPEGTRTCWLWVSTPDGRIESIPLNVPNALPCPEGYFDHPYVPSPPPPPPPPVVPPPPPPPPINSTFIITSPQDAANCIASGGIVQEIVDYNGNRFSVCSVPPPPPPPIMPPPGPGVDCSGLGDTYAVIGGLCYPLNSTNCNWPTTNPPSGSDDEPPEPPPPPCPPGCVRIDSVIGDTVNLDLSCTKWDNIDKACRAYLYTAGAGDTFTYTPDGKVTQSGGIMDTLAGFFLNPTGNVVGLVPAIFKPLFGLTGDASVISDLFASVMSAGFTGIQTVVPNKVEDCSENSVRIMNEMVTQSIAGWLETLSRAPISYIFTDSKYAMQFMIPQYIPSQAEFDNMYLAALINDEQWECYTKANGNLPNTHKRSVESKRSRIDARQAVFLNRYDKLDADEYESEMRSLGFIRKRDIKNFEESLVNLPGMSDIIRFMVRDTDDESVVRQYKLDEGFEDKYKEKLKMWAKAQGIPDDAAKYQWRAHWEYPSNTALYEMIRRLRPDKVDSNLQVTKADALKLLEINDVAPGWREKLLAISYQVPTRSDTKRGFFIDALKKDEVMSLLQDEGYTKEDAETIFKIFEKEKELYQIGVNRRNSAFTPKQIANLFADGVLSEEASRQLYRNMGFSEESIDKSIYSGKAKAKANNSRKCLLATKKKFFRGITNADETYGLVRNYTANDEVANSVFDGWQCEFAASTKDLSASKNVSLFLKGIIDITELTRRLTNLNYSAEAIDGWLKEALWTQRENIRKALEKAAREAERIRRQQAAERRRLLEEQRQQIAQGIQP